MKIRQFSLKWLLFLATLYSFCIWLVFVFSPVKKMESSKRVPSPIKALFEKDYPSLHSFLTSKSHYYSEKTKEILLDSIKLKRRYSSFHQLGEEYGKKGLQKLRAFELDKTCIEILAQDLLHKSNPLSQEILTDLAVSTPMVADALTYALQKEKSKTGTWLRITKVFAPDLRKKPSKALIQIFLKKLKSTKSEVLKNEIIQTLGGLGWPSHNSIPVVFDTFKNTKNLDLKTTCFKFLGTKGVRSTPYLKGLLPFITLENMKYHRLGSNFPFLDPDGKEIPPLLIAFYQKNPSTSTKKILLNLLGKCPFPEVLHFLLEESKQQNLQDPLYNDLNDTVREILKRAPTLFLSMIKHFERGSSEERVRSFDFIDEKSKHFAKFLSVLFDLLTEGEEKDRELSNFYLFQFWTQNVAPEINGLEYCTFFSMYLLERKEGQNWAKTLPILEVLLRLLQYETKNSLMLWRQFSLKNKNLEEDLFELLKLSPPDVAPLLIQSLKEIAKADPQILDRLQQWLISRENATTPK